MKPLYVHHVLRSRLERQIRPEIKTKPPLEELRQTEWNPLFEQYMRNRLVMGAMRYELFAEKTLRGNNYNCLEYIRTKCDEYERTGNLECLVDLANVALIEFSAPHHHAPHFSPGDDTSHVGTFK